MTYARRRAATPVLALLVLLAVLTGCSKSSGSTTTSAAPAASSAAQTSTAAAGASETGDCKKVRFALHAGLGAGAVHRWLWKPYQAGTFASGAPGRKAAIVKGALAGGFALHEFKVAAKDIQGCPGTQAITSALQSGLTQLGGLAAGLKAGTFSPEALTSANGAISNLESKSKDSGVPIKEQEPTPAQLATGNTGD